MMINNVLSFINETRAYLSLKVLLSNGLVIILLIVIIFLLFKLEDKS